MKDNFGLLETLEQLFAGDRQSLLTLDEFLGGLHGRSYAFAIAALNVPNCTSRNTIGRPVTVESQGIPVGMQFGTLRAAIAKA